jgi:hypothetical protein
MPTRADMFPIHEAYLLQGKPWQDGLVGLQAIIS